VFRVDTLCSSEGYTCTHCNNVFSSAKRLKTPWSGRNLDPISSLNYKVESLSEKRQTIATVITFGNSGRNGVEVLTAVTLKNIIV
jgi:hypothetical protein